ncbi:MAG: branched-chain amino acid ABC transporter permease [Burkholderiaceae bacterium]
MSTLIVSGLAIGMLYAAAAIVYNLMYASSKVLSITTGHLCMLGSVAGAYLVGVQGLHWSLGIAGAAALGALFGVVTEIVAIRRVLARSDEHVWILSTLALATIFQHAVALWWGTEPRPFPRLFAQDYGSGWLDQKYWLPVVVVLLLSLLLEFLVQRTMQGKLFIAMAEDEFAARARGIPTARIRVTSFALAGAIGAIAGFAAGQLTFAYFAVGLTLTLNGFIALAVGGIGSHAGAILAGCLLGLTGAFTAYYIGSEFQQTVCLGLLMLILMIKPEGLFGARHARAV